MFQNPEYKDLQWLDNHSEKGIVHVNESFDFKKKTMRPFYRNKGVLILSVGRVNYNMLDTYIIQALNDYYQKAMTCKEAELKNKMLKEYNDLYLLWYTINQAKQQQNPNLNSYYDDLIYRLYLLGYKNTAIKTP